MLRNRSKAWSAGIALAAATSLALTGCSAGDGSGDGDTPYYEGKTITMLVPFNPGGGADTTARIFAPLLEEFIPGNPTVIVENRGGGGSITGTNYFANQAPKDGTTLLVSSGSTHTAFALGDPAIEFDFADFRPFVGLPFGGVLYVRSDTGIEQPEDIFGPTDKPIVFAGENPSGGDLRRLLALDLLGVDFEAIFGYESAADSRLAFERGEATITSDSLLPYLNDIVPQIEAGDIVPIISTGRVSDGELVRIPAVDELMTASELYTEATGEPATGPGWGALVMMTSLADDLSKAVWVHEEAPDEAVAAIDEAFAAMFADPEARATLDAELAGNEPMFDAELQAALDMLTDPDPDAVAWLQDYLVERWDYPPFE